MRVWGFICLAAFLATFAESLATYALVRQPSEVGFIASAVLMVVAGICAAAAVMSKAVGFGDAAIPRERRGIKAAFRSVSIPLRATLLVAIAYAVTLLFVSEHAKVGTVGKPPNLSYFRELPVPPGETPNRVYTSSSSEPTIRKPITREEGLAFQWERIRLFTAIGAAVNIACAAFFFSRSARQSPELKKQLEQGMYPGQVDDSMDLNVVVIDVPPKRLPPPKGED